MLLGVVVALWAALLFLRGETLSLALLAPFPTVVSGLVIVLLAFDKWMWKWRVFRPWLVRTQDLTGTWRGVLQTAWKDPASLQTPSPTEAFFVIRQTYSTLSVRMLTAESESDLLVGKIVHAEDAVADLVGVYRNTPKQSVRHRSQIHHGSIRLRLEGDPVNRLVGEYWTDRDSKGELQLTDRAVQVAHGFEQARTLLAQAEHPAPAATP